MGYDCSILDIIWHCTILAMCERNVAFYYIPPTLCSAYVVYDNNGLNIFYYGNTGKVDCRTIFKYSWPLAKSENLTQLGLCIKNVNKTGCIAEIQSFL